MATYDNAYSRLVAWLKLLLPLAALAILSTLFLVARTIDPSRAIPYAAVDVQDLARDPRIGSADYTGMTRDGTAISVVAETARIDLDGQGRISAEVVRGVLETPDGRRHALSALTGFIDNDARLIRLEGDVILTTGTGYVVRSEEIEAALDRTWLESTTPVQAEGPPGRLTAGRMLLRQTTVGDDRYVLVFNGGVKLVYAPERED